MPETIREPGDKEINFEALRQTIAEAKERNNSLSERAAALEARLQQESDARKALEEKLNAQEVKKPQVYSRADLQTLVDNGRISENEMESILERQREAKIEEKVLRKVEERTAAMQQDAMLEREFQRYKAVVPDVWKEGAEQRQKVSQEFAYLRSQGLPNSKATELAALRTVLGPIDALEKRFEVQRESLQETHGATNDSPEGESSGPRNIPADLKSDYERLISRGVYSGWDDKNLKEELALYRKKRGRRSR